MNSRLVFSNIARFLILVLLQIAVLNNIYLGGYLNPFLFVLFIAMLPTNMGRIPMMLVAFFTGLIVDLTTNMLGIHAFTCTAVAFLRGVWLDHIIIHDNNEDVETPSLRSVPYQQFGIYLFLLILIYNMIYFTLLIFNFHDIGQILLSALLGTVVTWVLAILYQTLLLKKNDH